MNANALLRALVAALLLLVSSSYALDRGYDFESAEQQKLYNRLIVELRCLVCQNQNLADSNAELATDLRKKAAEMVQAGNTYDEVIEFMVARYGDFVIYRPPFKSKTLVLWIGPFVLLLGVIFLAWKRLQQRRGTAQSAFSSRELETARTMVQLHDSPKQDRKS